MGEVLSLVQSWLDNVRLTQLSLHFVKVNGGCGIWLYECVIHLCFGECVDRFGCGCLGPATDVAASIKERPRSPSSNFQLMMQWCEVSSISKFWTAHRITPQFYALGLEVSWLHSKCCFTREQPCLKLLPCLDWYSKACREIASTARAVSIMQGSKEKPWDPQEFKLIAREGRHDKSARNTRQKLFIPISTLLYPFLTCKLEVVWSNGLACVTV